MRQSELLKNRSHIPGLDGLRALAALAVFCVHLNQIVRFNNYIGPIDVYRLLSNGEHGVSLFFTLSGFLLALPFWRAINEGNPMPGLRVYAVRRIARIIPAYYVALTALVLIGKLWRIPGAKIDIFLHYSFLFNYTEFSIFSINPPFWTLAVEAQFYLLLPFVFLLIRNMKAWQALATIFILGLAAYATQYWLLSTVTRMVPWPYQPWLTWIRPYGAVLSHSLPSHLPHFLFGLSAAWVFLLIYHSETSRSKTFQRVSELVFWICLTATIILLGTSLEEMVQIPKGRYGLPVVPLLLTVLILSVPASRFARRGLDAFPLRMMGIISYGIYIYHLPCLNATDRYMAQFGIDASQHWIILGLISLLLTLVISAVSYIAIEKPILNAARRVRKERFRS